MKRKVHCANGNSVERFYDRASRSSVTIVLDPERNQVGEAFYDGNRKSAACSMAFAIRSNGGEKQAEKKLKK